MQNACLDALEILGNKFSTLWCLQILEMIYFISSSCLDALDAHRQLISFCRVPWRLVFAAVEAHEFIWRHLNLLAWVVTAAIFLSYQF
jgi:hypothetical protein